MKFCASYQVQWVQTALCFEGEQVNGLTGEVQETASRKPGMINISLNINDLSMPPANRLEKLSVNDIDTTDYYNSLICNLGFSFNLTDDDGNINPYLPTYIYPCPYNFNAKWRLDHNNNVLSIGLVYNLPVLGPWGLEWEFDWDIIKLTNSEMHIGGKSFDTTYRLEFKKI